VSNQDNDGVISFAEFCHAMQPRAMDLSQYTKKKMFTAFKMFEHPDHPGKVKQ
jgi:hypothetical protein